MADKVTFNALGQWSLQSPVKSLFSKLKLKNDNPNSEERPSTIETTDRTGLPISVRQEDLLSTLKRNEVVNASFTGRPSDGEAGNTVMMSEDVKKKEKDLTINEMREMERKIMPKTNKEKRELARDFPNKRDKIKFDDDDKKNNPDDKL